MYVFAAGVVVTCVVGSLHFDVCLCNVCLLHRGACSERGAVPDKASRCIRSRCRQTQTRVRRLSMWQRRSGACGCVGRLFVHVLVRRQSIAGEARNHARKRCGS